MVLATAAVVVEGEDGGMVNEDVMEVWVAEVEVAGVVQEAKQI